MLGGAAGVHDLAAIRADYAENGFCRLPRLVPEEILDRAVEHMDLVIAGSYETGRPPYNRRPPLGDPDPAGLYKIDQAHRCDDTIRELVTSPGIGEWAAAITGADVVQLFAVQLLHKEPTTSATASVGWHQDEHYWKTWWDGEAFTIWLAMSEVTMDSGPVCFVPGSHRWGYLEGSDFYGKDLATLRAGLSLPPDAEWREASIELAPGEATMHHRMTVHGSRPNLEAWPRRGFALHMRTERATKIDPYPPFTDEHDLVECPIIWDHGPVS
jgi:hypothetical protein